MLESIPLPIRRVTLVFCWTAPFAAAYLLLPRHMSPIGLIASTALLGIFIGLATRLVGLFVYGIWRVSKPVGHDDLSRADTIFLRIVNLLVIILILAIIWFGFSAPAFLPIRYGLAMLVLAIALLWLEIYK